MFFKIILTKYRYYQTRQDNYHVSEKQQLNMLHIKNISCCEI